MTDEPSALPSDPFSRLGKRSEDIDRNTGLQAGVAAFCMFDGTDTGTNVPLRGQGVASVTRTDTGEYTVYFRYPKRDALYLVTVSADSLLAYYSNRTKEKLDVSTLTDAGTATDASSVSVIIVDIFV